MTSHRPPRPLVLALCAGYFLVLLDVTVVNVALPQIDATLHAGSAGLASVVDGYAVPLAALLLLSGALGDRIGHRTVVIVGLAAFGAASLLCALAPTTDVLVAGRVIQGVGAAAMLPGTLALLVGTAPDERSRHRLVGAWAAIGGAALPAGPVIGGILVRLAGWRAVFWLSVPIVALALLPVVRHSGPGAARLPHRSVALPPVPPGARIRLGAACLVAGMMNLCALGGLFVLTQVFQDLHGLDPLAAGLLTLPAMLPLPLLGAPAGRLAGRIGVWRTAACGLLVAAAGMAGVAGTLTATGTAYVGLGFFLMIWGAGLGILTPAIVSAALRAAPATPGLASGASNTARQAGGALGIALFAALAGSAGSADFGAHSAALFVGSAALLAVTGLLCLGRGPAPAVR